MQMKMLFHTGCSGLDLKNERGVFSFSLFILYFISPGKSLKPTLNFVDKHLLC